MNKINDRLEEITSDILLNNDMYIVPVDVIKIANNNDIKVFEEELDKKVSGAIRFNEEAQKFEILVNSEEADVRKRFTIAHELGHYFLHGDVLKSKCVHVDVLYRAELKTEDEKDADYFAGALLMNQTLLRKLRNNNTITELAEIFNVSTSAMTVRLDILGIL